MEAAMRPAPASPGGSMDEGGREGELEKDSSAPVQWPLFGSPTLGTVRVTSYAQRGGTVHFTVQPTLEGFHWSVERTYEEFASLHKILVEHYGINKALLPGRKLFGYFGSSKPSYLYDMQVKLDLLLKTVLMKYPVPPMALLDFCGYPFCDVLSITQALAVYVYEEGDYVLSNNKALFMSPIQLHCVGRRRTLPIASSGTGSVRGDFGNLLDFLMQLKKLKIAPSTKDVFTLSPMEDVSFDLSLFKSLTYLLVDSIELGDLQGREALTKQLEGLDIRRCLNSLQEILVVYPVDLGSPGGHADFSRALQWTALTKICFKLNNITYIDKSLVLLPALESLDLSYNYIERIENLTELPNLKVVDLSYNKVADVRDVHLSIGNVSKLGLACNQITTLKGFAKCLSLVYLDLSSNQISEVSEVGHLSALPVLEELYLQGNPIKSASSYRSNVLSYLSSSVAEKVSLDGRKATPDELELSASLVGIKGHRRVSSRTADIRPDTYLPATKEAQEELEVSTSVTSRLEEMRKTGGDKWLSLLNTDKSKNAPASPVIDSDDVVAQGRGRERGKRHHRHHHHRKHQTSSTSENDSTVSTEEVRVSAPVVNGNQLLMGAEEKEEPSQQLQELIHQLETERMHLSDLPVTVLEYTGPLDSLSSRDVDQKLVNSRFEECSVCVDTSVCRLLETVLTTSRSRCQRDLALLEDIRFHEGKKKGVCLRFAQFSGDPLWVIYCVRDLGALARLYVAVQQALKTKETAKSAVSADVLPPPEPIVSEQKDSSQSVTLTSPQKQENTGSEPGTPASSQEQGSAGSPDKLTSAQKQGNTGPQPGTLTSPQKQENSSNVMAVVAETATATRVEEVDSGVGTNNGTSDHLPSAPSGPVTPEATSSSIRHETEQNFHSPSLESSTVTVRPYRSRSGAVLEVKGEGSEAALPSGSLAPLPGTTAGGKNKSTINPLPSPQTERKPESTAGAETDMQGQSKPNPGSLSISLEPQKIPPKLTTGSRRAVKKPGLDSHALVSFFSGKIAWEQNEVLVNILWGGASLTSAPGCEVESGLFVSNKGIYLLQVMDSEEKESAAWYSENPPLVCSFHAYHVTLSQVKMGIFDQSITFECVEKGALKSLMVFPRTSENTLALLDKLKSALDSVRIVHRVTTMQESLCSTSGDVCSDVLFVNPDVSDLQKLKESLVCPSVVAQLCSHKMVGYYEMSGSTFAEEIKRGCEGSAAKFEVLQYMVVSEISSDLLPVSNGAIHFRSCVLVLTNGDLYLCRDEAALWPKDPDSPISPPLPSCTVLSSFPIKSVVGLTLCERAQSLVRISDAVYEFRISFSVEAEHSAPPGSGELCHWQLCVYDRQYIDQFFTCLELLWGDIHQTTLSVTLTVEPLEVVPSTPTKVKQRSRSFSDRPDPTAYNPVFFKSKALVNLATLTSSGRLQFFKEHISEAQFMKSDEVPLVAFLALCSKGEKEPVQIEVCVIASQYAIYLVSDVENIRQWLDGGGPSSFSRMSLLNKQGSEEARCFFRLWVANIREINMGFFYLSMRLKTNKERDFCIHSQDATSMLALLSAFSYSANLNNSLKEKEMDQILSGYIDLSEESLASKAKQAQKDAKTSLEFREVSPESEETLKQILLCISPSVARSTTVEQSTSGLQIILAQVMVMIEEINIRGAHTVQYHPQLVLLSNYGLFVCANSGSEDATPAVLEAADLKVKRWCHIDLIEQVEVVSSKPQSKQCASHVFCITLQSQRGAAEFRVLVLAAQNSQQLRQFLYHLSLLWSERKERNLPVYTI